MRYYIIAGEASGDLHASNLIAAIKHKDAQAEIRAWGGDMMEKQGATIVKHYRDLAFMGFVEVILNLRTITRNLTFCKKDLLSFKPDVLILIDYPGFNLRIAEFAHKHKIKVVYYISPQIWAWKKGRVHTIKRVVDKMLVILPFEKAFYDNYNVAVDFVGHPLLDALQKYPWQQEKDFRKRNNFSEKPIIAMLPGSRKQEVAVMLKQMLATVKYFPEYEFAIAAAPSLEMSFYQNIIGQSDVKVVQQQTYDLIKHAHAAMVTSGTATLETALIGTPEVVCYSGNRISYEIARRIIDVKYISLVNLIMDREIVKELIQSDFNEKQLQKQLSMLLPDGKYRQEMLSEFESLRQKLGGSGASQEAADHIIELIGKS